MPEPSLDSRLKAVFVLFEILIPNETGAAAGRSPPMGSFVLPDSWFLSPMFLPSRSFASIGVDSRARIPADPCSSVVETSDTVRHGSSDQIRPQN